MPEWLECVQSLVDNRGLRRRPGDAGRLTVPERYSMKKSAAKFGTAVSDVAGGAALRE
jgi:hypothetical protein